MTLQHPETIRLELPADCAYLHIIGACITELFAHVDAAVDRETLSYNVQLATHEVCTNIVRHAYADVSHGRIVATLTLQPKPPQIAVDLLDTGNPFDIAAIAAPDLDVAHENGYGLFLIRSLMDTVTYTPTPQGNTWSLVKDLTNEGV